ncbi:MAG: C39 family peptidase [Bacilli bacterium]|nr:C39 family peptidase [Bacilli bacterium]
MKRILGLITIIITFILTINVYAITDGWETKNNNTYYYENNQKVKGIKTIDENTYYFNRYGVLQKNRLINYRDEFYYAQKDGSFVNGWKTVDKKIYYFNDENYKAYKGYHEIDGKLYYFYGGSKSLRKGFHTINDNLYYSDSNGVVQTGWQTINGKKYYFDDKFPHKAYSGYHEIDGVLYYFYGGTKALRTGFHKTRANLYYSNKDGVVQTGWQTIGERKYYFNENYPYQAARGYTIMDEKTLFFDPNGRLVTGKQVINGNEYFCTSEGEFIKIRYVPKYYGQKDKRWNKKKYGKYYFGLTGCAPTSLAMAYQSILERRVLPSEVGSYLYNKTNQFNKKTSGTSGKGIIYASKKYNINAVPITSKADMIKYLKNGNILYAAMQNGKFATKDWNHAIILYRFNNNKTYALDPLRKYNNGYVSINLIWKQKSKDKDDTSGGSAIYALLPND